MGPAGGGKCLRERCPQKCSGEDAGKQGSPGPHLPRSEVSEVKHKAQEGQPRFPSSLKLQVLGPSCTRSGCSHPESTGKDMGFYLPGTKHSSYHTCSVACGGGLERPGPVLTHWSWGSEKDQTLEPESETAKERAGAAFPLSPAPPSPHPSHKATLASFPVPWEVGGGVPRPAF